LGEECDYLMIDTPALLSVADPAMLATQAEAVILVVSKRKTQRQNLRIALEQLSDLKVHVVGIVMNRMPNSQLYDYYSVRESKHTPIWQGKIKKQKKVDVQSVRFEQDSDWDDE